MSEQGEKSHGLSDEAILKSVRAGNRQAFEQLVQRWQGELMRFLRLLGADYDEAEDVVQETFLKLYARSRRAEISTPIVWD